MKKGVNRIENTLLSVKRTVATLNVKTTLNVKNSYTKGKIFTLRVDFLHLDVLNVKILLLV